MKDIRDAVNTFRAIIPQNLCNYPNWTYERPNRSDEVNGFAHNGGHSCTLDQFNDLVSQMKTNFGACNISYSEHCSNESVRLQKSTKELNMDIDWSETECEFALVNNNRVIVEFFERKPSTSNCEECWMVSTSETLYLKNAWALIEKPQPTLTYTQAMADNSELPSVGMEFMCGDEMENDERTVEFKGVKVKVIGISVMGKDTVITFCHDTLGVCCGIFFTSWVKPLTPPKTDKEKAIDDLDRIITDAYNDVTDSYKADSRFRFEAIRLLDEIMDGQIHGVSFQPLTVEVK